MQPSQDDIVRVGIAEGAIARRPQKLRTTGLGSCVGVILVDPVAEIAGLAHVMLPQSPRYTIEHPTKYADSAVAWMIDGLRKEGADISRLFAKLAGGAQMFAAIGASDFMRVGPRNVEAVLSALRQHRIMVVAEDTGGNLGRTIEFDITSKKLTIRTAMRGTYVI